MSKKQFYLPFAKRDDVKRLVYGYATTEAIDSAGESISKAAVEGALNDYMKFANIREMHQNSAVGVAKSANIDEKGLYLCAKIVDDDAWKKVVEGVYKGFSVGGKAIEKSDNTITRMRLTEISVVDRPANPEAVFDLWKADSINTRSIDAMKTDLNKSLQLIEMAARILGDLDCFRRCMVMDGEGMHAGCVGPLDAVISSFGALTVQCTSEEVAELSAGGETAEAAAPVADAAPADGSEPVAEAAAVDGLAKAKTVHMLTKEEMKSMREAYSKLGDMLDAAEKDASGIAAAVDPKKPKEDPPAKDAPADEKPAEDKKPADEKKPEDKGGKAEDPPADDEEKVEAVEMAKIEGMISKAVEPLKAENAKLLTELEDIKKRAAPAKASVTNVSVSKGADVNANAPAVKVVDKDELIAKGDTNALLDDAFAHPSIHKIR